MAYRTDVGRKVYLAGGPDRGKPPLGDTLASVAGAADRAGLLLYVRDGAVARAFGRLWFGRLLSPRDDDALAFDPIRNAPSDLRPTGIGHGSRAFAYRLSQRWRGATPDAVVTAMPQGARD